MLRGKLLRFDVNGGGLPLDCGIGEGAATLPPDNPFTDGPGGDCDEVYAYGFRNPFRFSFGPDGRLWLGDVGQNTWEEVDLVAPGGNYGWNEYEGNHCFDSPCNPAGKVFPIHEYRHLVNANGGYSVTAGYVYAGANCVELRDRFVYGDYVLGNVWALDYDGTTATNEVLLSLTGKLISSFGQDEQGELYLADMTTNDVLRFECASTVTVAADPVGSTVVPPGGGPVTFDVTLTNTTAQPQTFDAWVDADLSNGDELSPAIGPRAVTLPAGARKTTRLRVDVPASAPAGLSTLTIKVGRFPDGPADSDRFTVQKEAGAGLAMGPDAAWEVEGWLGGTASTASGGGRAVTPTASPNPFFERTTVRFALAEAGTVRLSVHDVLGREVALLLGGEATAGQHAAVFDARGLASGIYLWRLVAGGAVQKGRITLLD